MSIIGIDQRSLHTGGATWTRKSGHAGASAKGCSSQCSSGCQGYLSGFSCPSSRQGDQEMMHCHSARSGTVAVTDRIWLQMMCQFPLVPSILKFLYQPPGRQSAANQEDDFNSKKPDAALTRSAHRAEHMRGSWQWIYGIGSSRVHFSALHVEPLRYPYVQYPKCETSLRGDSYRI